MSKKMLEAVIEKIAEAVDEALDCVLIEARMKDHPVTIEELEDIVRYLKQFKYTFKE